MASAQNINNKVFIVNRSQLERRAEPEFYAPSIYNVEAAIRKKAKKRLSDFILKMASGATPLIADSDKHYTDKNSGVPFLRVQNLQTNGSLYLEDIKYIHLNTHKNSLKRSQVGENDLLVKITGVGRMAIASVPPVGFIGNTNQHMVVIKTESREVSEYLANYLNLDIIEKLATRRSAGGTRPALDYNALKSIPIIEGLDFTLIKKAEHQKQQKEAQAKQLLESIDTYLLSDLGIALHTKKNTAKERIFLSSFSEVVGLRFDPLYFNNVHKTESEKYENAPIRKIANINKGQSITKEKITEGNYPVIAGGQTSPYNNGVYNFEGNIITISASGAYSGFVWYHNYPIFASDCIVVQSKDENNVSTEFLYFVLKALQSEIYKLQQGAGQPHVYARDIEKFTIPVPPIKKQKEILKHIKDIQQQITKLKADATSILENAKAEVEKMILG